MKTCSIYTLEHPVTGEIRYVGRTIHPLHERLYKHIWDSKNRTDTYSRSKNWIKSLTSQGLRPIISEIDICLVEDCHIIESYWISQFKTWGFDILNHRLEDKAPTNVHSYEEMYGIEKAGNIKEKVSKSLLEFYSKNESPNIGKKRSTESKKKMSDNHADFSGSKNPKLKYYPKRKIIQYDKHGNSINEFQTIPEASKITGISKGKVQSALTRKHLTSKLYYFKYINL